MNLLLYKVGFLSGTVAFLATSAFVAVQLLQFYGIISFPLDEILIYSTSLIITIPFLLEILVLHHTVPDEKKLWSHAAVLFTAIYVLFVSSNYVTQLFVVIPATLHGYGNEVSLLTQNPHSMFWFFDAAGYIFMGGAAFLVYLVLKDEGIERKPRILFLAHSLTTPLIACVYFSANFISNTLLLAIPWALTAPLCMLSLAIMFRKKYINEIPGHHLVYKHLK